MKFWQKIFFSTFLLFFVVFDIGAFILVRYSYDFSLQRETDSGMREQSVILSSVESSISNVDILFPKASQNKVRLNAIVSPLADYYKNQGVALALYLDGVQIYSDAPAVRKEVLTTDSAGRKNIADQRIGGKRYLFVSSVIPTYPHLTFLYVRDISQIDTFRTNMSRLFIIVSGGMCMVLGLAVFLLLKRLTRPISQLNCTTGKIAAGAYGERVQIHRKDELGELGQNFNLMADSVEDKVEQLTKAAEDKQSFIDNLAHEMKTPLTSILGYSEYLQNAKSREEERVLAAGHLHDAALRLQNLSARLLDIAYMHHKEIELQPVKLEALFVALEGLMQPSLSSRGIILETDAEVEELPGDETLLLSLLTNLTENAVRASSPGNKIKVRAYQKEFPIIEVTDEGCGMPAEEIGKITEPFYRVDKSRSRAFGGVGLGLSLCKQIADLHGAALTITSEPEVGTSVQVIFTTRSQLDYNPQTPRNYPKNCRDTNFVKEEFP